MLRGRRTRLIALLAGLAALLTMAIPAVAAAPPAVPARFVGVTVDGPLYPDTAGGVNLVKQFGMMEQSGIESVRVVFDWSFAQPYANWSKVPAAYKQYYTNVGGIPTDFAETDEVVRLAAEDGMTVLPTVIYAPSWDRTAQRPDALGRPARTGPYTAFLTDLVNRYGPKGTFWTAYSPKVPIRQWQIWNEPNIGYFWPTQPFAKTYVSLLKAAHAALRKADPGAQTVLAGMPNFSWKDLAHIYAVSGARAAFDVVAIHPYTAKPAGVIEILQNVRKVMDKNGDAAKPLIADEISWTSSKGQTPHNVGLDIATTEQGQAKDIATLLPMLAKDRQSLGLSAFYYYNWAGAEGKNQITFNFAGLLKYVNGTFTAKPALQAFTKAALAMEHCRKKGSLATQCASRS